MRTGCQCTGLQKGLDSNLDNAHVQTPARDAAVKEPERLSDEEIEAGKR